MSECRSRGLNFHPSSQGKKISIGILDTSVKRSLGVAEGNSKNAAAKAEKVPSVTKHIKRTNSGGILEDPGEQQTSSPWVTTRSFLEKSPALEFVSPKKGESSMKKFDGATCSRATKNDGWQRAEGFTFTNAQEVSGSRKPELESKTDEPENGRTESKTLKMKLWDILGTPPNKQQSDIRAAEVGDQNLKSENAVDCVVDTVVKPGENSDTIELDSESPDHTTKRPVTRALTRKQSGNRRCPEEAKTNTCKQQAKGRKFSFDEGWLKKQAGVNTIKVGASVPQRTRGRRKDSNIRPSKPLISDKVDKKVEQTEYRHDGQSPRQKTSPFSDGHGSFHDCVEENTREKSQSATTKPKKMDGEKSPAYGNLKEAFKRSSGNIQGQDFFRNSTFRAKTPASAPSGSSSPKTDQMGNGTHSPAASGERNTHRSTPTFRHSQSANRKREKVYLNKSPENVDQEIFVDTALEDILGGAADFHSPTFAIKTPIVSTSAGSTPINMDKGAYTPETSREEVNKENDPRPKNIHSPRPNSSPSSSETELPDDAEEFRDFLPGGLTARREKGDTERKFNESSSEENDSDSDYEASPVIRGYNCEKNIIFPTVAEETEFSFRATKRTRSCGENRENYWSQESLEQNQDNDMARVVKLFVSAIDRIRRKMNSATRKKSMEIMMSISEEIKYQLQYAESQIQTDMLKLTSFSKGKRKSLEKRCQEQQEQMKLIQEKFSDQLDHHLQDCISTVEELESHQAELKGMVKKQKAEHQKLVEQVEEVVETQISYAEKRVAAVRESGRQKLMQLKLVVVECLKDEEALGL